MDIPAARFATTATLMVTPAHHRGSNSCYNMQPRRHQQQPHMATQVANAAAPVTSRVALATQAVTTAS